MPGRSAMGNPLGLLLLAWLGCSAAAAGGLGARPRSLGSAGILQGAKQGGGGGWGVAGGGPRAGGSAAGRRLRGGQELSPSPSGGSGGLSGGEPTWQGCCRSQGKREARGRDGTGEAAAGGVRGRDRSVRKEKDLRLRSGASSAQSQARATGSDGLPGRKAREDPACLSPGATGGSSGTSSRAKGRLLGS